MKICILSDSHDHRELFMTALGDAKAAGAEAVLHCGDIVAPSTLKMARRFGLPVHAIDGNNTGDTVNLCRIAAESQGLITFYGHDASLTLADRRIFMVHYPHYAYGMACTGDWDIVCFGHDHRFDCRRVANVRGTQTVLLNPGTVAGIGHPPTWVLADLKTMEFTVRQVAEPCVPA